MNYTEVDIYWEGPFDVVYDRNAEVYSLADTVPEELVDAHGFYQIYGEHPVYGKDVLLYIGETKPSKSGKRGFGQRMREHLSGRFWQHCGLTVRFGRSYIKESEVVEPGVIEAVESLLIASNMPALNRKYLDNSKGQGVQYLVRNWGFKGSIVSECSSGFWSAE